jgi:hypothetical protein
MNAVDGLRAATATTHAANVELAAATARLRDLRAGLTRGEGRPVSTSTIAGPTTSAGPAAAAYSAPRPMPVEYVQPGDLVEVHRDLTGPLYAAVVAVLECEDPDHDDLCATVLRYPATEVHYSALAELTVRVPAEPTSLTRPDAKTGVWVQHLATGDVMHRTLPRDESGPRVACSAPIRDGGIFASGGLVATRWPDAVLCSTGCWWGAS